MQVTPSSFCLSTFFFVDKETWHEPSTRGASSAIAVLGTGKRRKWGGDGGTRPGIHASRRLSHILEEDLSIFDKNSKIILDK